MAAIKATLATWRQASLAGDWPSFFGQFTEDAVWIGAKGQPVEGLAAMKKGNWVRAVEEEPLPIQIADQASALWDEEGRLIVGRLDPQANHERLVLKKKSKSEPDDDLPFSGTASRMESICTGPHTDVHSNEAHR